MEQIFVSSVQKELQADRYAVRVFVHGNELLGQFFDKNRHPKMKKLIRKAGDEVVRRRYTDTDEMLRLLYGSLIRYLQDQGVIATVDFDATPCPGVTLKDISLKKLRWFLEKAREERGYALSADTPRKKALAHLNLLAVAAGYLAVYLILF